MANHPFRVRTVVGAVEMIGPDDRHGAQSNPGDAHDLPRARRLMMLEFGSRDEFENPRLEYRRLFSELLGTFGCSY